MTRFALLSLMLFLGGSTAHGGDDAKLKKARAQIVYLDLAVEAYARDHVGQFPDDLQQLVQKTERAAPYVPIDALRDPWGEPYRYDKSGKKNDGERPDIWTTTPAKEALGNWQNKPKINALRLQHDVRRIGAQALAAALSKAVDVYALKNNGVYPDRLEDLLEGKPALLQKETLLDPWQRPFQYDKSGPKNNGKRPDIWTNVPNSNEQIGNWDQPKDNPVQMLYDAKVKLTRANLEGLTAAVKGYAAIHKRFPLSLFELADAKAPFVPEKALLDPWGNPYQYDPTGPFNEGKLPDIWTESPMRERIGNWEKDEKK